MGYVVEKCNSRRWSLCRPGPEYPRDRFEAAFGEFRRFPDAEEFGRGYAQHTTMPVRVREVGGLVILASWNA